MRLWTRPRLRDCATACHLARTSDGRRRPHAGSPRIAKWRAVWLSAFVDLSVQLSLDSLSQEVAAEIGSVTGRKDVANLRRHYSPCAEGRGIAVSPTITSVPNLMIRGPELRNLAAYILSLKDEGSVPDCDRVSSQY